MAKTKSGERGGEPRLWYAARGPLHRTPGFMFDGVWQIIGAALVVGTAQSFSAPAYQAMLLDLLDDRARLPDAIAMNALQFNLSRALGPLLASLTLTAFGTVWCFLGGIPLRSRRPFHPPAPWRRGGRKPVRLSVLRADAGARARASRR